MPAKLYVVDGSHPCRTVERALQLKGVAYKTIELPPPSQVLVMPRLFSARTVPGITFASGEKVQGSRKILERLEEMVPAPSLVPEDAAQAQAVLAAERWGDEVLQPLARRVIWPTMAEHPGNGPSYTANAKLKLPAAVVKASMPLIARIEMKMNATNAAQRDRDVLALPGLLDKIDAWIEDGTLGADGTPNRADLQIAPSLKLLMTMEDLRDVIAPRPAGQLADRLFPEWTGSMPRGSLDVSRIASATA